MALSIKTNQFATRKQVDIENLGEIHTYTVRKLGNIEQLDLSQYMRRMQKIADIEREQEGVLDDTLAAEVENIQNKIAELFTGLFDDGGNQKKSKKLVASLSDIELSMLLAQIFEDEIVEEETKVEETPDVPTPEEEKAD